MIIPTLVDPTMAPPGGHVMSCFVQYAPYRLAGERVWDDAAREAFGQNVIDTIEERFPTIRTHIVGSQFITPKDIEDITGLTEGNIFQGELSLEQLFFNRPVPGLGSVPHTDRRPLDVRIGDASRRRHHGRSRPDRRARGVEGVEGGPGTQRQGGVGVATRSTSS